MGSTTSRTHVDIFLYEIGGEYCITTYKMGMKPIHSISFNIDVKDEDELDEKLVDKTFAIKDAAISFMNSIMTLYRR